MRRTENLNQDWWFNRADKETVEKVILPHTVEITPANASGGRNYQGKCRYQRSIRIPEAMKGKQALLEFDGAMGVSKLFVNSKMVGEHFCGYTPFVTDVSAFLAYGQENEIVLELDNSDNAEVPPGKPQAMLDFSYEGGLYRNARITYLPALHITNALIEDEVAGGGVFLWTKEVQEQKALLGAKVQVRNQENDKQEYVLQIKLKQEGEVVAQVQQSCVLTRGEAKHSIVELEVSNPMLWNIETPHLYQAEVSILQNDEVVDQTIVMIGIRTFSFTYKENLIFNGVSRRLSGGNYHQSFPYIGNAVPDNLLRRDARKLRGLGLENVRSHYPFADAFVDECDRLGLTMLVANPGWQWFQEGVFAERLIQNLRRIIRWQRNHPCIILWEPMPNESVVPQEFQQILHNVVHEEYPYGDCYTASDHGPTDVSYRMYDPGMLEPGMEGYNPVKRYGPKSDYPLWIREYNDAPDNWNDQNCAWRTPRNWGDGPQLKAVERMLGKDSQNKGNNYIDVYNNLTLCGYGIWPAMEHNRGYHVNPCWGGFLDLFRIPKFTAYFIESQQDVEQMGCVLYFANWWTDISPWDVTIFSNAEKVRLYHDEVLVEEREPEAYAVKHPPFVFTDVHTRFKTRDRSILRAEALIGGEVIVEVSLKTPGTPAYLELFADVEGVKPIAGDIIAVRCMVKDADGGIVPYSADNHPIFFEAKGACIVGDASVGANPVCPEAGIATILLRMEEEKVVISARLWWQQNNERAAIKSAILYI